MPSSRSSVPAWQFGDIKRGSVTESPAPAQNPVTREPQGAPVPVPAKPPLVADPDGQVVKSEKQTFKIEVIAREIETPWAIAFLPDGRLLITERPGRLRIVDKGKLLPEPVKGTAKVWEKQDGGLFDVEVHPKYAKNGWIYFSYSETLPGFVAPPTAAPQPTRPRGGGRRRTGTGWPARAGRSSRSANHDGHRPRQDQQEQRVDR